MTCHDISLLTICLLSLQWAVSEVRNIETWETSIMYQVYPRSFKDSNGDGIGDLQGILEKLDYIKDIGVHVIWIQPFFKSGGVDMGYDITDYKSVDPLFGDFDGFLTLVEGIHHRGMMLMLDFVPNHSSIENEWFKLSEQRVDPYTDYFIWHDGKTDKDGQKTVPNNWLSVFGGSAWTWSEKRQQYYFRQFAVKQPDLNFHNPNVIEEMNVLSINGAAVIMEELMGHKALHLACRHHMFEIILNAVFVHHLPVSAGPDIQLFRKFQEKWEKIDETNFAAPNKQILDALGTEVDALIQFVSEQIQEVLRFWLDMGVDGFRVDAIKHLVEAEHLKDEPVTGPDPNNFSNLDHIYTLKQPENYKITHQWRMVLKEYETRDGRPRLLSVEDYDLPVELARYLGNETYPNVQIPINYIFQFEFKFTTDAKTLEEIVYKWIDKIPLWDGLPNWAIGNHDNPRVSSRYHPDSVDSINMLLLMLPGMAIVYYGEEIGHEDSIVRPDQRQDPNNGGMGRTDTRDCARGPMIWDDTNNAGFTTHEKPWLPVTPHYWKLNVKTQLEEPNSHLKVFKRLVELRKTSTFKTGDLQTFVISEWTLMLVRNIPQHLDRGSHLIVVVMNLGSETNTICLKKSDASLPQTMTVYTSSLNSGYNTGDRVQLSDKNGDKCPELRPKAGLVLTPNDSDGSHGSLLSHSLHVISLAVCANLLRWTYN